jgi:membrane-associated phospholipid phosphatase
VTGSCYWRQKFSIGVLFCSLSLTAGALHGQQDMPADNEAASEPVPAQAAAGSSVQSEMSLKQLPMNILRDQKSLLLFPEGLAHRQHWLPTIAIVGATAGLLAADPHDVGYFRRTTTFHGFNQAFSGNITTAEIVVVPASLYLIGLARKDSYSQTTGLLAGEALADSLVVYGVINAVTRRWRPSDIAPQGPFNDTFFHAHNGLFNHSFPSGHTIEAFAVATIIARRYQSHRWVPWVAYGAAGAIGFSRVTNQAHFPADVFLGAALGYSISRFEVLRGRWRD